MLVIPGRKCYTCEGPTRRELLRAGSIGLSAAMGSPSYRRVTTSLAYRNRARHPITCSMTRLRTPRSHDWSWKVTVATMQPGWPTVISSISSA